MYDTRYTDKVETGKLMVSKLKAETPLQPIVVNKEADKPKASKRKLSPDGSSTKPIII